MNQALTATIFKPTARATDSTLRKTGFVLVPFFRPKTVLFATPAALAMSEILRLLLFSAFDTCITDWLIFPQFAQSFEHINAKQ